MKDTKNFVYVIEGPNGNIEKFLRAMEILWDIKDIKIQKLELKDCDIISTLSGDQRKIIDFASKCGYYDYPRKITSEELAEKIGYNKDEVLENLRKAEKCIINRIFNEKMDKE